MTFADRSTCRLCSSLALDPVLDLGNQYVVGFVKEADESLPRAPLVLMECSECGLLQLGHTVNPDIMWKGDYWYRSGVNQTMRDALRDVVRDGFRAHTDGAWLDIGANDGTLLSMVPREFEKVAVEPAQNLQPLVSEHADRVYADYFPGPYVAGLKGKFNVITSCAMFYDLDDPNPFVAAIRDCLTDDGIWINQLSHTPDMLKQNAFDNICHEHACYYDIVTLHALYARHGLAIASVKMNDVNGGSFRVAATKNQSLSCSLAGIPVVENAEVRAFSNRVGRWKEMMTRVLTGDMTRDGDVWLYGASTKASVMLQYLGLSGRITAAADRNPAKYGLRMAGTWIPITDEGAMRKEPPRHLLVGPWAFRREFIEREKALRAKGTTMWFPLPNIEAVL